MAISSSGGLIDALRQHELLSPEQLADLTSLAKGGRCGEARGLAKALIQKSWLSVYQVNQLLLGKGHELTIGPYFVLEKLGQGGLSSVFKAQRRDNGNVVALKMIKPEVFANPEGRQAFLLEVEAMARFDHPNIVQFCDADQWRDTYYFAMEYVEGTDLGKIIRLTGALPVHEACDYIRQAALGLQHAFERNLVHRDIKPVNLFLTHVPAETSRLAAKVFATRRDAGSLEPGSDETILTKPLIKILDWGLASLRNPQRTGLEDAGQSAKCIVGTADYLSPEQATNANAVDIRSDLYSLGCSLYFLLTGQPPFPDGALMQKILLHQQGEPIPIEEFRNDVPQGVRAIVKRLMAKRPDDRFQTPASTALALLSYARRSPSLTPGNLLLARIPQTVRDDTPLPPELRRRQQVDADGS
jgi:serine/threonine-protein kinase